MDRLTLDQAGARHGELFRHSLQMGGDTVTIENIATLSILSEQFQPFKTPRNQNALGLWTALGIISGLTFIIMLAIWSASNGSWFGTTAVVVLLSLLLTGASLWFGVRLALAIRKVETFYRLRIGASDGRQIDLVDDNEDVLVQIRDAIRIKIDEGDAELTGTYNLDTDTVNLTRRTQGSADV
ncbi:MAG: DUF6232 family protein [Pseudomonadota bacterium]